MEQKEFIRLAPQLRGKAMAIGQSFFASEEEAEDVAQETIIRLWKVPRCHALPSSWKPTPALSVPNKRKGTSHYNNQWLSKNYI